MMDMELGANKNALQSLLGALYKLMADKKYGEDDPISSKDMSDVMDNAKEEMMDEELPSNPMDDEVADFMTKENRGKIPKATAVMMKVTSKKPMDKPMPKKKGKGKKGKGKSLFGKY